MALQIQSLSRRPDLVTTVADWIDAEWGVFSGRSPDETLARFRDEPGDGTLPASVVATLDTNPAGIATLRESDSVDWDPDSGPWICNVYVPADCRGRGVAGELCVALEQIALDLHVGTLYLANEHGEKSLYARLGYEVYATARHNDTVQYLMRKRVGG